MKISLSVPKNYGFTWFMMNIGCKTDNSRIFLHKKLLSSLIDDCDEVSDEENFCTLTWYADDIYCKRKIKVSKNGRRDWKRVLDLDICRVDFTPDVKNPRANSFYISVD